MLSLPEHQTMPHPSVYGFRGPANLRIQKVLDPVTHDVLAHEYHGRYAPEILRKALAFRDENTHEAGDFETLTTGINDQGGFWVGPWCGASACEEKVSAETSATIRVLPLEQEDPGGACAVCGQPGVERATWAKAY